MKRLFQQRWAVLGAVLVPALTLLLWATGSPMQRTPAVSSSSSHAARPLVPHSLPAGVEANGVISGTVLDTRSKPLADARVWVVADQAAELLNLPCRCQDQCTDTLLDCDSEHALEELQGMMPDLLLAPRSYETRTGSDGAFRLEGLPAGNYVVWAWHRVRVAAVGPVQPGAQGLELRPVSGTVLDGRVMGTEGPIAGVVVLAVRDHLVLRATSDAEGRFSIGEVPEGEYWGIALQPGQLPVKTKWEPWETETEFLFQRHVPLRGQASVHGQPAAGAVVRRFHVSGPEYRDEKVVRADTKGEFAFGPTAPGDYLIRVAHDAACAERQVTVRWHQPEVVVALPLAACPEVFGRVLSAKGHPVAGCDITLAQGEGPPLVTETDGAGAFRVLRGTGGALRAECPGYATAEAPLDVDSAALEVIVQPAAVLRGVVLDERDDTPVPNAALKLVGVEWEWTGTSETDGTFLFDALSAGEWTLEASKEGFFSARQEVTSPNEGVEVRLSRGGIIRGVVLGPTGEPCMGAKVQLSDRLSGTTTTDHLGGFAFTGLSNGRYTLEAEPDEDTLALNRKIEILLRDGRSEEVTLNLEAAEPLFGVVRTASGKPVETADIGAELADEDQRHFATTFSDRLGHFLMKVPKGRYTVTVNVSAHFEGETGRSLELVVGDPAPPTRITGRVLSPEGAPVFPFFVRCMAEGDCGHWTVDHPDGRFVLDVVGTIEVQADGFLAAGRCPSFQSAAEDLGDIVLSRPLAITGKVIDAENGAPVPGAFLTAAAPAWAEQLAESQQFGGGKTVGRAALDGSFSAAGLEPGDVLLAWAVEYLPAVVPIPSQGPLTIPLSKGATIRGTILAPPSEIPAWMEVFAQPVLEHTRDGEPGRPRLGMISDRRFQIAGLRAGRYLVTATNPRDPTTRFSRVEVDLVERGTASVELRPFQGLELRLVVTNVDGFPTSPRWAFVVPDEVPFPGSTELLRLRTVGISAIENESNLIVPALRPGRYTLFVEAEGRLFHTVLDLQSSTTVPVKLALARESPR